MSSLDPDLVAIDGPNLFNSVGRVLAPLTANDDELRDYLLQWFDVDRFVQATLSSRDSPKLGIVVFHSPKALGRAGYRISNSADFWARQGANPHTACMQVVIPGEQTATYAFECTKCGESNSATSRSEKGIDTAITTYLFETREHWTTLCIFSRDVDFVPPVESLRRRGKRVFVACEASDESRPLVQVCQNHFILDQGFLRADLRLFRLLREGGWLDGFLAGKNLPKRPLAPTEGPRGSFRLVVENASSEDEAALRQALADVPVGRPHRFGPGDTAHLQQELTLRGELNDGIARHCRLVV